MRKLTCKNITFSPDMKTDCAYTNPKRLEKVYVRKTKEGTFEVSIDLGKTWIGADFNEKERTLTFSV